MSGKLKPFMNEGDVRKTLMNDSWKGFRIEAAHGGTLGLPDCFWPHNGMTIFAEVKCAVLSARNVLTYSVRPDQCRTLGPMKERGMPVMFYVGEKGTRRVFLLDINDTTLTGRVSLKFPAPWWRMVEEEDVRSEWWLDDVAEFALSKRQR
jgi:hypothetical protein